MHHKFFKKEHEIIGQKNFKPNKDYSMFIYIKAHDSHVLYYFKKKDNNLNFFFKLIFNIILMFHKKKQKEKTTEEVYIEYLIKVYEGYFFNLLDKNNDNDEFLKNYLINFYQYIEEIKRKPYYLFKLFDLEFMYNILLNNKPFFIEFINKKYSEQKQNILIRLENIDMPKITLHKATDSENKILIHFDWYKYNTEYYVIKYD